MALCPRLTGKASTGLWGLRQGCCGGWGSRHSIKEFLCSGAGISWGSSLQEYCSGGVASHSERGADGEAVHVVLTVAALSLTRFMGLELSFSSSLEVKKRSDMEGVEVERLSIL